MADRIDLVRLRDQGTPERSLTIKVSGRLPRAVRVLFRSQVVIFIPFVDRLSFGASWSRVAHLHRHEVVPEYLPQLLLIVLFERRLQ